MRFRRTVLATLSMALAITPIAAGAESVRVGHALQHVTHPYRIFWATPDDNYTVHLAPGWKLISPNGRYSAAFRQNCDFEVLDRGSIVWSSGSGRTATSCQLRLDGKYGSIQVRNLNTSPSTLIWRDGSGDPYTGPMVLIMRDNGNLVQFHLDANGHRYRYWTGQLEPPWFETVCEFANPRWGPCADSSN